MDPSLLDDFLAKYSQSQQFGISGAYLPCSSEFLRNGTAGLLTKLAIASPEEVLVITLHFENPDDPGDIVNHTPLYQRFFSEENPRRFVGFSLDRIALQLWGEYGLSITDGVDVLAMQVDSIDQPRGVKWMPKQTKQILDLKLLDDMLSNERDQDEQGDQDQADGLLASRAWVAVVLEQASSSLAIALSNVMPIDLRKRDQDELLELHKIMLASDRLRGSAEEFQSHDVKLEQGSNGKLYVISSQFNTRVRDTGYELELTFEHDVVTARVMKVKGRRAEVRPLQDLDLAEAGQFQVARTLGKEEATCLDHQRSNFILFALQGQASIRSNPILRQIWFPSDEPSSESISSPVLLGQQYTKLNRGQRAAVQEMMKESSDNTRIVLVHGPPGTGKTSVIAAMTECLLHSEDSLEHAGDSQKEQPAMRADIIEEQQYQPISAGPTLWIVAQSNVAVKNVAEKLVKVGIHNFKLIVSTEFHFEWHEHIYGKEIRSRMHTSAELPRSTGEVRSFLGDTRIMLCTLSMLTSPRLRNLNFFEHIPVKNVVIDEASQIQLGDLIPMIHIFQTDLKRICLVGDHRQLAPYGQEEVTDIESVFERKHIVSKATLLNVTYRLPKPICNLISAQVYDTKLLPFSSEDRVACCKWIDVRGEEQVEGTSYINTAEVEAVLLLIRELEEKKKDYRIISPYATQTALILRRLKEEKLPWDDKCFNVDSFQGNEADFIIISLVRTTSMGFLDNNRRANVLLTRCKKGMFVLCSRNLMMSERAQTTLLGRFAYAWSSLLDTDTWPTFEDLQSGVEMVEKDLVASPKLIGTQPVSKKDQRRARKKK